jgi:RHS repeat-associated protein
MLIKKLDSMEYKTHNITVERRQTMRLSKFLTRYEYDTATGMYNYGYRDYSPRAARFTTVDPIRDGNKRENHEKSIVLCLLLLTILIIIGCKKKNNNEETGTILEKNAITLEIGITPPNVEPDISNNRYDTISIEIYKDPFLLGYLRNYPTIRIDTSENVAVQRIWYKDFDKKEIDYSDAPDDILNNTIYLFKNGIFEGIDNAVTNNGELVRRYKVIEIKRDTDESIISIDQFTTGEGRFLRQHIYKKNNNVIVANDGLRRGVIGSVLVEEEKKFIYYSNYQDYDKAPDEPEMIIEYNNEEMIVDRYAFGPRKHRSRFYFTDGILMKREYFDDRTETYTVSSGKGEIIVTEPDGTEIERRMLERRINNSGFIEYEAVRLPSGEGYEFFFTKDKY